MTLLSVALAAAAALQAPLSARQRAVQGVTPRRRAPLLLVAKDMSPPSSLETKLLEEHAASCERAASVFGVTDDASSGGYSGGWATRTLPPSAVSESNDPYASDELLRLSEAPLLSAEDCQTFISLMEAHGASRGWDARYPVTGYTREVNVAEIPEAKTLLGQLLRTTLLPAAAEQFPEFSASSLRCNEAIVVKYDAASGQNCLPVHQDFSLLTYNIALASSGAYEGGGTWFQYSGETIPTERGHALLHAGRTPHCGVPVTSGSRYQLVLFLIGTQQPDLGGRLQASLHTHSAPFMSSPPFSPYVSPPFDQIQAIGAAAGAKGHAYQAPSASRDLELSCTLLERALEMNGRDLESWSQLAHNHMAEGRHEAAERCFATAAELSGGRDFAALTDLAAARRTLKQPERALEALLEALGAGPPPGPQQAEQRLSAQHNLGTVLTELERYEEAGLAFEAAVDEDGDAIDSWAGLGLCMAKLGQPEAALACQRQVLALQKRQQVQAPEQQAQLDGKQDQDGGDGPPIMQRGGLSGLL
jgi:tetratricopeptide (TPR) repeat protein|tara:strand:- start:437 stop:2032 length:1596 start_codon:yes stop_codon:yes gene_type:complete